MALTTPIPRTREMKDAKRVSKYFDRGLLAFRTYAAREGHGLVPEDHIEGDFNLGIWVYRLRSSYKKGQLSSEKFEQLDAINGWTWNVSASYWDRGIEHFLIFQAREGHGRVPARHVEGTFRLGNWVSYVRSAHRKGKLAAERVAQLQSLPNWIWVVRRYKCQDQAIQHFLAFQAREGHGRVPYQHIEGQFELGKWVGSMRAMHNSGKLNPELVVQLQALPFWTWDSRADLRNEGIRAYLAFQARNGHGRVPRSHVEGNFPLGQWVATLRNRYGRGQLSSAMIRRFEMLPGWTWHGLTPSWDLAIEHFLAFHARNGHGLVPSYHFESGFRLGRWVAWQRKKRKRGLLSAGQIEILEALPGWAWVHLEGRWEKGISHYLAFQACHQHGRVPSYYVVEGFKLGIWVSNLRAKYLRGRLPSTKIAQLESLPGWLWVAGKGRKT